MTIKLEREWVDYLIRQPVSGIGFQKVDVRLKGNRVLNDLPVFNAEQMDLPEDCANSAMEKWQLHKDCFNRVDPIKLRVAGGWLLVSADDSHERHTRAAGGVGGNLRTGVEPSLVGDNVRRL